MLIEPLPVVKVNYLLVPDKKSLESPLSFFSAQYSTKGVCQNAVKGFIGFCNLELGSLENSLVLIFMCFSSCHAAVSGRTCKY